MIDFIKSVFDFVVLTVVVKIIIGHWLAERIMEYSRKLFSSSERNMAIWLHYQQNHLASSVLHCADDKCAIFSN